MIDPDEDTAPRLEAPSDEPPPAPGERLQRRVAVLIMVVTLVGAFFAFLQTSASNRAARATRLADTAAVAAMARLATGGNRVSAEDRIWSLAYEDGVAARSLAGAGGDEAAAVGRAYLASREALLAYTDLARPQYQRPDGSVDWSQFVEEALAPSYSAVEYQKAYAAERDGWGAKGGSFVAVLTVLAVALFLIGLSRTPVAAASGGLLVGAGAGLASVAALWGLVVLARPVAPPSPEAVEAYVEARVAFNSVVWESDPGRVEEALTLAETAFDRALQARPGYFDAYLGRGTARFRLDLLRTGGPAGSEGARDDFARAVSLNPLDAVAWGDLGAARFWLGELDGAGEATRRALELDPDDLVFNLNLGLFLTLEGDAAAFEEQWARIAALAAGDDLPTWLRTYSLTRFAEVLSLAAGRGADYAAAVPYRERLVRLDHQVGVSKRFFGTATPPPVTVVVSPPSFALSEEGTRLVAVFAVTGVAEGEPWLWRTYRGGVEDATLSAEPQPWAFGVPDEPELNITLDLAGGFAAGVAVRVEVFFEGNLVQAGEFTP